MRRFLPVAAFVVCVAIWGSTWLAIKEGYAGVGPFTAASLRFLLAAVVLVAIAALWRVPFPRDRTAWALGVFVGLVLFGADYGLIYWGEQFLPSGLTAVLFAVLPLSTALLARAYIPGERLGRRTVAGILLGVAGVALLFRESLASALSAPLGPMLAIVLSALCASASSVATKRHGAAVHPVTLTAIAAAVGATVLAVAALVAGEGYALPTTRTAWIAIAYLALAGSVVTFLLYFWLLQRWSATRASFIAVLTPLVALSLGVAFRGEAVTGWVLAGTAAILGGVALANLAPGPSAPPPDSRA